MTQSDIFTNTGMMYKILFLFRKTICIQIKLSYKPLLTVKPLDNIKTAKFPLANSKTVHHT